MENDEKKMQILSKLPREIVLKILSYELEQYSLREHGAGILIKLYRNRDELYFGKFGLLTNYTNEVFQVGSLSKVKMLKKVLELHAKELLSVDAPIKKYIPELAESMLGMQPVSSLLTHTSGLTRDGNWGNGVTATFPRKNELRSYLLNSPRLHETRWAYSNIGYELLKMVIERVEKSPYITNTSNDNYARLFRYDLTSQKLKQVKRENNGGMEASIGWRTTLDEPFQCLFHVYTANKDRILSPRYQILRAPEPDWRLGLASWNVGKTPVIGHQGDGFGYAAKVVLTQDATFGLSLFSNVFKFPVHQLANQVIEVAHYLTNNAPKINADVAVFGNRTLNLVSVKTSNFVCFFRDNGVSSLNLPIIAEKKGSVYQVNFGGETAFFGEIVRFSDKKMFIGPYEFTQLKEL